MICNKCGKESKDLLGICKACQTGEVETKPDTSTYKLLSICLLALAFTLTITALVSYFVALFGEETNGNSYTIASTYVLVMLLVAPTLKVFLDKLKSETLKRLSLIAIVLIYISILVIAVFTFLSLGFPNLF
ncbi:MAG: hypothetical protein FWE36_00830 [Erysipelotrichales bacterium]|nr:hypothetical protein [Erysipelotrichales bacterium]